MKLSFRFIALILVGLLLNSCGLPMALARSAANVTNTAMSVAGY